MLGLGPALNSNFRKAMNVTHLYVGYSQRTKGHVPYFCPALQVSRCCIQEALVSSAGSASTVFGTRNCCAGPQSPPTCLAVSLLAWPCHCSWGGG